LTRCKRPDHAQTLAVIFPATEASIFRDSEAAENCAYIAGPLCGPGDVDETPDRRGDRKDGQFSDRSAWHAADGLQ